LLAALACAPGYAAPARAADLTDLSLEQLGDIEVTSVSRRTERLADAPASIYVITNDRAVGGAVEVSGLNLLARWSQKLI